MFCHSGKKLNYYMGHFNCQGPSTSNKDASAGGAQQGIEVLKENDAIQRPRNAGGYLNS